MYLSLPWFGPHSWDYSRPTVAFAVARPQLFGVARLTLALSSCRFSKLPRFLSDRREIHRLSVNPGFPRVAKTTRNNDASTRPGPGTVRHSVRQYLIEGPELFVVHRWLLARTS
jgi:hypothetical protein